MGKVRRGMNDNPVWGREGTDDSQEIILSGDDEAVMKSILGSVGEMDAFREPSYIETVDNRIYFYGDIDRHRILQLNKKLRDLNIAIQNDNIRWTIPESPHIYLHINSNGGSIFSGLAGMDEILQLRTNVTTIIDGCCASAATFLSVVGTRRLIHRNACMLIHQLSSAAWGNYSQMQDEMKNLDMLMKKIEQIYKKHTRMPVKQIKELLKRDLWLDAEECLEYGLVDEIIG